MSMGNIPLQKIHLDIVSDVVCPWCYLGKKRIESALSVFGVDRVEVSWRPYQLAPDMPKEGMDRKTYYQLKFGDNPKIKAMSDQLVELGKQAGIRFNFDNIAWSPNTLNAHRLIRWARSSNVQDQVVDKLFQRYFENGENIGADDILLSIAKDVGMDVDLVSELLSSDADSEAVQQEMDQARHMGVSGVPTFIAENRLAVSGAQEPAVLINFLEQVAQQTWLPDGEPTQS